MTRTVSNVAPTKGLVVPLAVGGTIIVASDPETGFSNPPLDGFTEVLGVRGRVDPVGQEVAVGIHHPQEPVVVVDVAVAVDQRHEGGAEVAERRRFVGPLEQRRLVPRQCPLDRGVGFRDRRQDAVARFC